MQQIVVQDGFVVAIHPMDQDIDGKYPGAEILAFNGHIKVMTEDGKRVVDPRLIGDPRIVGKRPATRLHLIDDDGNAHTLTVARDGTLQTRKEAPNAPQENPRQ